MPTYSVKETWVRCHEVEADNEEDAVDIIVAELETEADSIEFADNARALGFDEERLTAEEV